MATSYFDYSQLPIGTSVGYSGIYAASCGIQYNPYRFAAPDSYGYQPIEKTWEFDEAKPTIHIKDKPKKNPNGYRQRKLKARLNQVK